MNAQAEGMAGELIDAIALRVADIICDRLSLTGWQQQTPPEDDNNILRGWKAIATFLQVSESTAKKSRKYLGDAIHQAIEGGSVYAYKEELTYKYNQYVVTGIKE